jgi:hypothetical protein
MMYAWKLTWVLLVPALAAMASPPGSPMSEFGPSQVGVGIFFDHSGQNVFREKAPSVMNQAGLSLSYAPWPYLQYGVFGGGAEFDISAPVARQTGATAPRSFDGDYSFFGGATAKLATPRVLSNTSRLVAFGAGTYFNNEDKNKNVKKGMLFNAGGSFQFLIHKRLNLVAGAEFYALDGSQVSSTGGSQPFGLTTGHGGLDYVRALVGADYFLEGKNHPFISVAFRPSSGLGWNDNLGLRGGSVSICFGAIATLRGEGEDEDDGKGILNP